MIPEKRIPINKNETFQGLWRQKCILWALGKTWIIFCHLIRKWINLNCPFYVNRWQTLNTLTSNKLPVESKRLIGLMASLTQLLYAIGCWRNAQCRICCQVLVLIVIGLLAMNSSRFMSQLCMSAIVFSNVVALIVKAFCKLLFLKAPSE